MHLPVYTHLPVYHVYEENDKSLVGQERYGSMYRSDGHVVTLRLDKKYLDFEIMIDGNEIRRILPLGYNSSSR